MKRLELKKLITCTLIMTTITSTGAITAKAETTPDTYNQAYDATMKVVSIGNKYDIIPRHANNNTSIESNSLKTIYKAVKDGNMQVAINKARECINKLPEDQWKAKNTFSEILDGYQQPSYEHIVNTTLKLDKLTKDIADGFQYNSNWNEKEKDKFCESIKGLQFLIEMTRTLNKGVDPTYGNAYSSALDIPQQRIINMINVIVNQAQKTIDINDVNFADNVLKAFKEYVNDNSNLNNYINRTQLTINSLKVLSEIDSKLGNSIKEINKRLDNLEQSDGSSTTIIQVPKELQDKVDKLSNLVNQAIKITDEGVTITGNALHIIPLFDANKNKELLDKANNALDVIQNDFNRYTLKEDLPYVSDFLNYDYNENKEQRNEIYDKMYDIAKPIVDKATSESDVETLKLCDWFLSVGVKNSKVKALHDEVLNTLNELEKHAYETELNNISDLIKNIKTEADAKVVCNKIGYFRNRELSDQTIAHLDKVTNQFYNFLAEQESKVKTSNDLIDFSHLVRDFLSSLRDKSPDRIKTEDFMINFYSKGINELKKQSHMDSNKVRMYVSTELTWQIFGGRIEENYLKLIEELGNTIIEQIAKGNSNNEPVINEMIEDLQRNEVSTSERYLIGDRLEKKLNEVKENLEKPQIKKNINKQNIQPKNDKLKNNNENKATIVNSKEVNLENHK